MVPRDQQARSHDLVTGSEALFDGIRATSEKSHGAATSVRK